MRRSPLLPSLLLAALVAAGATLFAIAPQAPAAAPAKRTAVAPARTPRLVVQLVVDQMRADYVEKYGGHWTKGLRRLVNEGAWFRQAAYPYLTTVTCVGHSSIATGSVPHTHGIIANDIRDRESGKVENCVDDSSQKPISYGLPGTGPGTSTKRLRVPTFSDELRVQAPVAPRIVTMSMKDYTATTLAGRRADAATWVDRPAKSLMTSSAFTSAPVPWVAAFLKAHPIEADFGKAWTKLLPESAYQFADDEPGELVRAPWTRTFPHPIQSTGKGEADIYLLWEMSPFSDAYLGKLAEASIDALKLGQGAGTDYLAISFSSLDLVGHDFGPRSHEVQDVLARLDVTVGSLIDHLDRSVGRDNYVLALTADHGVSPIPEQMAAAGEDAGRIVVSQFMDRIEKALEPFLGPGKKVARLIYNDLFFEPGVYEKLRANPAAMRAAIAAAESMPGILRAFSADDLENAHGASGDAIERAVLASFFRGRSGDFVIVPRPYYQAATAASAARGTGTTHGSPYWYDRHVPVILFGKGIKKGEYEQPASPIDIAPTFAFLCRITLPAPDGRVLDEALVAATPAPPRKPAR